MAKPPTNRVRMRVGIVALVLCIICPAALAIRLLFLQLIDGEKYKQMAIDQQLQDVVITPHRGTIYDANMKILAMSADVYDVVFEPANLASSEDKRRKQLAALADEEEGLAAILGIDPQIFYDRAEARPNSYWEVLKKQVDKEKADQVNEFLSNCTDEEGNDLSIPCIQLVQNTKRFYPFDNLASTVLGFVTSDNRGAYGIESYYNKILTGTEGRVVSAKNALNGDMPFKYQKLYESQNGNSLVLTIDETVQHFVDKHLEVAVVEHEVDERAVGIVMNVKTGEVLAMSTKPDFNPNDPRTLCDPKAQQRIDEAVNALSLASEEEREELRREKLNDEQNRQWRNKAISDPYEPGSVFKIITAAAALDSGSAGLGNSFFCPGYREVADNKIRCWKRNGGHGNQTFEEAMMHSCNPAFIDIGQMTGVHNFSLYFDRFGLTDITGIDLPGESGSIYYPESKMGISELSSGAFGQTFKITPIQLITAVAATLNGGELVQPYVVKQVLDADKNVVETYEPQVKRQVISKETSQIICDLGESVVDGGDTASGRNAAIKGYRIGGKTGTSEKLDKRNEQGLVDKNVLSFLAFTPADDPEIAVLVALDEPHVGDAQSSTIAVPVVAAILEDILPYLGYEPSYTQEDLEETEIQVDDYMAQQPHEAQIKIRKEGLKTEIIGQGPLVVKQIPEPGATIPFGGTVILYTDETVANQTVTVPDILGKTAAEANQLVNNMGLNIKLVGESELEGEQKVIVAQEPPAGTVVESGSIVIGEFAVEEESSQ